MAPSLQAGPGPGWLLVLQGGTVHREQVALGSWVRAHGGHVKEMGSSDFLPPPHKQTTD